MRIGFDAKRLFNNFTGLGNYSRWIVQALQRHYPGHEYLLFSPRVRSTPATESFLQPPFQLITCPYPQLLQSYWRSVMSGVVAHQKGVTLFHGLSNELPLRKPAGLPMVCSVHDLIFLRYPQLYNPVDRAIYTAKMKAVVRQADRIVCISKQTAEEVEHWYPRAKERIRVVYQGCDDAFYKRYERQRLDAVKEKYNLPTGFVLMVGTLERRKNAALLIRALSRMKTDIAAVFVGRATAYQRELDELVQTHGLQKRVHFLHAVSFTDLPLIYQLSSGFVYPSRFEGFGIPVLEAMASGLPVITSREGVFAEVAGPDSWYVGPDDAEELAHTIEQVLLNSAEVNRRLIRSTEFISRFSSAGVAAGLMHVYHELS